MAVIFNVNKLRDVVSNQVNLVRFVACMNLFRSEYGKPNPGIPGSLIYLKIVDRFSIRRKKDFLEC
jgi:hypothetical protein